MSLLSVAPDIVSAASGNLQNLGSALRSANAAAASQTTAVAAPAADEVSAAITTLFGTHAQEFQALSAKAATFHDEFTNLLNGGAAQYVSTELTNAEQTLANAVNAPAQALLGHPLIGTGQGTAGAAANAADTIFGFNYQLGPFGVSLNVNNVSFTGGGLGLTGNGAVTLNTPFGSPVLGTSSFSESMLADGSFSGNILETLGPLGVGMTMNGGTVFFPGGGYGLAGGIAGNLYTPFGSPMLVRGNVGVGMLADGSFFGNIFETFPPGAWVTVDATGFFSSTPVITGLAYNFDGLEFSFPGTTFLGPIVPNVSWNPTP